MASARRGAAAGAVKAEPRAAAESPGPEPRDEAEADVIQQAGANLPGDRGGGVECRYSHRCLAMLGRVCVAPAADADEQLGTLFTGMGAWFHANIDRTVVTFWSTPRPALPRTCDPEED